MTGGGKATGKSFLDFLPGNQSLLKVAVGVLAQGLPFALTMKYMFPFWITQLFSHIPTFELGLILLLTICVSATLK